MRTRPSLISVGYSIRSRSPSSDGYVIVTGDVFEEFAALDELDGLVDAEVPGAQTAAEVVAAGAGRPVVTVGCLHRCLRSSR